MKSCILLPLFILISICFLKAQEYTSFPEDNAAWTVLYEYPTYGGLMQTTKRYFLNGETIVNGKKYTRVYQTEAPYGSIGALYVGGIREKHKRIFFQPAGNAEEYVLYDFNLEVGDIWDTQIGCDTSMLDCCVVMVADTFLFHLNAGETRRGLRLGHFTPDGNGGLEPYYTDTVFYWIEGIGSTRGLLDPTSADDCGLIVHPGPGKHELLCFTLNNNRLYGPSDYDNCFEFTTDVEEEEPAISIALFPNPVGGNLTITADNTPSNDISMIIVNLSGQAVQTHSFAQGTNQWQIDTALLPPGVYFLSFYYDGTLRATEQIVKG